MNAEVIVLERTSPCNAGAPRFNTVLLYEDLPLGERAWDFYENLTRKFEGDFAFRHLMWSFAVLDDPQTLRLAAQSAAGAHLIILAFSGRTELPTTIKRWVARWVRLAKHKPALVTLMDPKAKPASSVATHTYLREVLEAHGIDFFPHTTSVARIGHLE